MKRLSLLVVCALADNVCCAPKARRAPDVPGTVWREFPRPKPLCAAGRTTPRKLTKDLPPVPAASGISVGQKGGRERRLPESVKVIYGQYLSGWTVVLI